MKRFDDLAEVRQLVASIYRDAGIVYRAHGDRSEAERHWLRAAAHDPADTQCRMALADLYREQGRLDAAAETVEELRRIDPRSVPHALAIGRLRSQLKQFEAAEAAFECARELAPRDCQAYLALAQLYLAADRKLPEALSLTRKAVELRGSAIDYLLLAAACEKNADLSGAAAALEQAIRRDPGNSQYRTMYERLRNKR